MLSLPSVDPLAVLGAGIAGFVVGGLWYAPFSFGNAWVRALGKTPEEAAKGRGLGVLLALVVTIAASWVLAVLVKWTGVGGWIDGLFVGGLVWLGFLLLLELPRASLERHAALFLIPTGHKLAVMLVMGAILGQWA